MLENELRVFDYYFFSVGIVSLITAFFMLSKDIDIFFVYILIFFYFINFCISFLLNILIYKKLKEVYIWEFKTYILSHMIMAAVTSVMATAMLVHVQQTIDLVSYFLGMNSVIVFVALIVIFMKREISPSE